MCARTPTSRSPPRKPWWQPRTVYRWLTRQTPGVLRQLEREFVTDDHRLWPKDAPDQPQQMPTPLPQKTWQKIGERMQTELDLRDKEAGGTVPMP